MSLFDELAKQYYEIDRQYLKREMIARSRGLSRCERHYQSRRRANDHAYFLLMFTRLEGYIRHESAELIRKMKDSVLPFREKAAWGILPHEPDDRIWFMNRVALLTPKGEKDYNTVVTYYKERNSIAHGGDFISPIHMPDVIAELERLHMVLKA